MPRGISTSSKSMSVRKNTKIGNRLCHWRSSSFTFQNDGINAEADAEKKRLEDAEYEALAVAWLSLERQPAPPRKSSPGTSNTVMKKGDCGKRSSMNAEKSSENAASPMVCLADPDEGISSYDKPPKESFMNLITTLNETPKVLKMVRELILTLDERLQASALRVYKIFPNITKEYLEIIFKKQEMDNVFITIRHAGHRSCKYVSEVASTGNCMRVSKNKENEKYLANTRELFKIFGIEDHKEVNHVLFIPIFNDGGVTTYVLEIWRANCFTRNDEELSSAIVKWGSVAIHYYSSIVASQIRD